jgi:hypothetical protein
VSQVNTLALASHRIFTSGCRHDSSPEQLPRFVNTTKTFKNGNYDDSLPHNLDPGPVRHVRSADSHARSMARSATNAGRPCSVWSSDLTCSTKSCCRTTRCASLYVCILSCVRILNKLTSRLLTFSRGRLEAATSAT